MTSQQGQIYCYINVKELNVIPNNEKYYKEKSDEYEKIMKKFLKAIPKSILKEHLIKFKIIKQDYITEECEMVKKDPRTMTNCNPKNEKVS